MTDRKTDPPRPSPPRATGVAHHRLSPDEYEIKIRWEKARRVLEVTSIGVKFEFDSGLKVGVMYPITLTAPGVSLTTTLEVTRCQLVVASGRFFLVEGRFYPQME